MVKVKHYISSHFVKSFLMIFLPFFFIISLVYLVKIATLTSKIQITFFELLALYSYSITDIIFYTLPLSFVAALANVLIKLSQDNELIVLYALGLKAKRVLRPLLLLGLLFSLLLGSISFFAMPLSKQLYKSFKEKKKSEAKLNLSPGELGQKFGNYYIYIKDKNKNTLNDIVIYNRTDKNNEQFFAAKTAKLNHKTNITSLLLNDGFGYTYAKNKLQQAKYQSLEVYDEIKEKPFKFENIISYWQRAFTEKKMMHRALFFIFISLIPLLSVYLVASFSIINPRYQANHSFLIILFTTLFLYFIGSTLEKIGTPLFLGISIILVTLLGQWLFHRRVSKYF